ncbi:unnamed protein product [Rotaria socialis]|uniref:Uncharacterized protein n=1 Tax=Rotaria socialis TaxID=392032 RepID=A0A820XXX2_9BILA|nr:unnamed protein product [Rotaria socialis]CAF4540250.1 unnamed protein product [Rotaria socialis]
MAYSLSSIDSRINGIRNTAEVGVGGIENYAKKRAHREPVDEYEEALVHQSESLENDVHNQVDDIKQYVLTRQPRTNDTDYERKRREFIQFTKHATEGMTGLKGTFSRLFSKIKDVVKRIARWIRDNLPNIVRTIGVIFKDVVFPILGHFTGHTYGQIPH